VYVQDKGALDALLSGDADDDETAAELRSMLYISITHSSV
jgi:hypothetical protein